MSGRVSAFENFLDLAATVHSVILADYEAPGPLAILDAAEIVRDARAERDQVAALTDALGRMREELTWDPESGDVSFPGDAVTQVEAIEQADNALRDPAQAGERWREQVGAEERERCAKTCEGTASLGVEFTVEGSSFSAGARRCAASIRALGASGRNPK